MKIKIRQDARKVYTSEKNLGRYNYKWCELLDQISGMVLEVDTEYLFRDQFSTFPLKGGENGLRIMQNLVEEVIEDIRPIYQRCNWCGKKSLRRHEDCPHCNKNDYLEKFGDANNAEKFIIEIGENHE